MRVFIEESNEGDIHTIFINIDAILPRMQVRRCRGSIVREAILLLFLGLSLQLQQISGQEQSESPVQEHQTRPSRRVEGLGNIPSSDENLLVKAVKLARNLALLTGVARVRA
jgi:hypothetical protein